MGHKWNTADRPRGLAPADRPTEWTSAVAGIITAALMWLTDHHTAALVSAIGAALPALITAATEFIEGYLARRRAQRARARY